MQSDDKKCSKCGELKPITEFEFYYLKTRRPELRRTDCKTCVNTRQNASYHRNKYKRREGERKRLLEYYYKNTEKFHQHYLETKESRWIPLESRWKNALRDSKRRNLPWDLTLDLYKELIAKPCEYCGETRISAMGYELDRMDNQLGYIKENVVHCCPECNWVKSDLFSYKEMKILGEAVRQIKARRLESAVKLITSPQSA